MKFRHLAASVISRSAKAMGITRTKSFPIPLPPSGREVDFAKQKTEGECESFPFLSVATSNAKLYAEKNQQAADIRRKRDPDTVCRSCLVLTRQSSATLRMTMMGEVFAVAKVKFTCRDRHPRLSVSSTSLEVSALRK